MTSSGTWNLDGKYTCHEYKGSSTVDYFIVQVENYDKVISMKVLDLPWYSDHCPLSLVMKVGIYNRSSAVDNMNNYITPIKITNGVKIVSKNI